MLPNLHIILFFIYFIIKSFLKLFMNFFAMGYIIFYNTPIIPNILDKMDNRIEFRVVKY